MFKKVKLEVEGLFMVKKDLDFTMLYDDGAYQIDKSDDSQFSRNSPKGQMSNLDPNLPRFLQPSISSSTLIKC